MDKGTRMRKQEKIPSSQSLVFKISSLSFAGLTAIVNQAILLAPGRGYLRLLKLSFNDIIAESLAVTVAGPRRLVPTSLLRLAPPDPINIQFSIAEILSAALMVVNAIYIERPKKFLTSSLPRPEIFLSVTFSTASKRQPARSAIKFSKSLFDKYAELIQCD